MLSIIIRDAINIILIVVLVGALSSLVHSNIAELKIQNNIIIDKLNKCLSCYLDNKSS